MALSGIESQKVYEIIGVPNTSSVLYIDGAFGAGRKVIDPGAILTAKTEIDAILAGLDVDREARVRDCIAQWDKVVFQTTKLKPNTANEGVDVDPSRARANIRAVLQRALGIFVDEIDGRSTGGIPLG